MEKIFSYPRVSRRVQALLIDGLVASIAAIGTLVVMSQLGGQGVYSAVAVVVVIFIVDPLSVSVTGGTPGHHLLGLRVISKSKAKNINIFYAVVRYVVKVLLGWFSIISIFTTKQHQAIHDALVGSIVILKNPESMASYDVLNERVLEEQGYLYPTKLRRVLMIIVYNTMSIIALGVALIFLLSENCMLYSQCSWAERALASGLPLLWMVSVPLSIIYSWKGALIGCRRRLLVDK
ncbi:MAG: RDD family protein [Gammaproteobacteria bacterium]|nr:RDD family protein [Gammaproteobacteria bacterium]